MSRTRMKRLACVLATIVWVSFAPSAHALVGGPSVTRRGPCSDVSHWSLTVRAGTGDTLVVRLLVAGGAPDQRWHVLMEHNGERFFSGSRISGTGGAFAVRRRVEDLASVDTIRIGAYNTQTAETCRGRSRL